MTSLLADTKVVAGPIRPMIEMSASWASWPKPSAVAPCLAPAIPNSTHYIKLEHYDHAI